MDLSFNGTMEAYYQKFIELQEKLRKSEEERLKLEMKFNEMLQITREEEQAHYRKLRSQYKRFLEEDKKRQERNERIIRALERIEARVNMLTSKTDRFKILKRQYQNYLQRILRMRPIDTEHPTSKIEEDIPREQQTCNISEHNKDLQDQSSLKKALGKSNDEKIEILDKYLQSLSSQKCRDAIENNEKVRQSDLNQLKHLDDISKKMDDGFNSNQANSIAEDIMKSIYSRHYKKDLLKDEAKKANKFTAPNYMNNDIPLKQKIYGFGDSYKPISALENLNNDALIGKDFTFEDTCNSKSRPIPSYTGNIDAIRKDSEFDDTIKSRPTSSYTRNIDAIRKESEFDDLNKISYAPREDSIGSSMFSREADNKEINSDGAVKALMTNRSDSTHKNKDYTVAADPLTKNTDSKSKADQLLKNGDVTNNSKYPKSNQIQRQEDFPLKIVDNRATSNPLFGAMNSRTRDFARNDSEYLQGQIDPLDHTNSNRNKVDISFKTNKIEPSQVVDHLLKDKVGETKNLSRNEPKNFIRNQSVKNLKLNEEMSYGPSKTEIDITENEKQITDDKYYSVPSADDIQDGTVKPHDRDEVVQEKIDHPKPEKRQEHFVREIIDNDINIQSKYVKEQSLDNTAKNLQNNDESYTTKQLKQGNNMNSKIPQEIKPTVPDEDFEKIEFNQEEKERDINSPSIPEYKNKIDMQSNERIREEYPRQQVINDDQSQYVENQEPIQYDQYEEQYDNQINYDKNGQVVQSLYDEKDQLYDQNEHYDETEQQYDENNSDIQYDENGQPIHSYSQQYDESGQAILYEQQYDASGQPIQQVFQQYDQNEQPTHAYDPNSHPVQYNENGEIVPQYNETGQLIQEYNNSEQPIHAYDQSDQPAEYIENSQTIQGYEESAHLSDQYDQGRQSMQGYAQPLQQYENAQSVEQYNSDNLLRQEYIQPTEQYDQGRHSVQNYEQSFQQYENEQPVEQFISDNNQLDQEYVQPFQQYDANGQPIPQYDESGQLMQQYDENGQPMQQYDENGQPMQQYDENGQPMQQYDENGQPMQQYDGNGQPMQQYDENGQPLYQYDENIQPLEQYNDRGHHYDENSLSQYDKHITDTNNQSLQQYDDNDRSTEDYHRNSQPIQQPSGNAQLPQDIQILETSNDYLEQQAQNAKMNTNYKQNDNLEEEKSQTDSTKSIGKKDQTAVEEKDECQPIKQKNVLEMLDTDTESIKQSTSKISNDSDFDFSNG